jgi:hypothetical protein
LGEVRSLLGNLALFLFGFLPTAAVVSMVLAPVLEDPAETAPEWRLGWNPFLWWIMTAPWLLPAILAVPALHFLGKWSASRFSRSRARRLLLGAAPALFLVIILVLWGPENFRLSFVLPVAISGFLYGAVQRIPAARG